MNGISVIVPTFNRKDFISNTVQFLLNQDFEGDFEIIIVDQSDKINLSLISLAKRNTKVKYFFISTFRGVAEARNFGFQKSNFEIILQLDDDIECNHDFLQSHFNIISKVEVDIVAGGIIEKYRGNSGKTTGVFNYWKALPIRGFHNVGAFYVEHFPGANYSIRREVLSFTKGIDENFSLLTGIGEETDFSLRISKAGFKIFFSSKPQIIHLAANTGGCTIKNLNDYIFSIVRNRTIIIERHLNWYHKPSAYFFLLKLVVNFCIKNKNKSLLDSYIKGIRAGKQVARMEIKVSNFN